MVARTELDPARRNAEHARQDVPWQPTPRAWLRRLTLARCLLCIPLGGILVHRLFVSALGQSTLAFTALLLAGMLQAIAFRIGARRDRDDRTAELTLHATFFVDLLLLSTLAVATEGIESPFTLALALPTAAAALVLRRFVSASVLVVALLVVPILVGIDTEPAESQRWMHALFAVGFLATAYGSAAWVKVRADYLERRADAAEAAFGSGSVVDWEEVQSSEAARIPAEKRIEGSTADALAAIATQISHELRDPAAMIRARAESLRYELRDRTRRDDLLPEIERLLRSADRLEDVRLTLATLGGARVAAANVAEPRALLDEIRDAFANEFERDGVRLRFEAPRVIPAVGLTHNELRLLMVRWLDAGRRAAIAHGRNARLVARFTTSDGTVVLEVEDPLPIVAAPGCDLPPDHEIDKRPGLGLALAVARLLLVPRGGRCETELRRGGGLVLRARLPRPSAAKATNHPP